MPNHNQILVCVLCLLFAIAGGIGGYNLKSRLQNTGKSGQVSDLPALRTQATRQNHRLTDDLRCSDSTFTVANSTTDVLPLADVQLSKQRVKNLIRAIHAIAVQQGVSFNLDDQVKTEVEFINLIAESPDLVDHLLNVYQHMPDSDTRHLLRSLLTTTGSDQIQQSGLDYLSSGDTQFRAQWLELLRDAGINSSANRERLFHVLPGLSQTEEIRDAILSIVPKIVSPNERQQIFNHLNAYLNHADDIVRSAAINTLTKWADSGQTFIIEQALDDASYRVRYSAISAAQYSGLRSGYIESKLLDIMNNSNEDLQLRIDAHHALSNYRLQGQNYDQYFQFHQQLIAIENSTGAKG